MTLRALAATLLLSLTCVASSWAQTPASKGPAADVAHDAKLTITVVDPSGGVLPTALVTVIGQDDATRGQTLKPVIASDKGVAEFDALIPGLYTLQGEFNAFETTIVKDVKIKSGDNKHALVLALKALTDTVTVTQDKQEAASDRTNTTFGTALTREQVAQLSDDPTELQRQLQDMAGPDAVFRVDGFEGAPLPLKAQIKAIHITRDQFAAENHYAGGTFIDIVTQPGIGPLRGSVSTNVENSALDGKNPLIPTKGPSQYETGYFYLSRSLLKNRADFTASLNGSTSFTTPSIYAVTDTGTVAEALNVHAPRTNMGGSVNFNYALTPDQTLKAWYSQSDSDASNLGVGDKSLLDHAYSTHQSSKSIRFQEAGPIGRRLFMNTRVFVSSSDSSANSNVNAPTIIVNDAFTSGGAQMTGATQTKSALVQSDLDYVRGIHSFRFGTQLQGYWYNTNSQTNYLGTYTFSSLADFEAGAPALFSQRIGDPIITYAYLEGGFYAQDDIRVRKNLTISPGVRYELQDHSNDHNNLAPRIGLTWSPFKSGKTSVRASAGIFYDWISNGTYEQTLRFDGTRQDELDITDPTFPETNPSGAVDATSKYLLGPNLQLARSLRLSTGFNQTLTNRLSVNVLYAHTTTDNQLSGVNLNAPVDGVRPDPLYSNVFEALADASTKADSLGTGVNIAFEPPSPAAAKKFFDWRRGSLYLYYTLARANSDALGAFTTSPTGTLATEWGPANNDVRHRASISVSSSAIRNLYASVYLSASSGTPYTITTGSDDNGDSIFNDRPAGVGRNTLRTSGQWTLSANVSYSFGFGHRNTANMPGGIGLTMTNGQITATTMAADPTRYHMSIYVYAYNLTNHSNLTGYSGVITSPFFMQPTTAAGPRSVSINVGFSF